MIWDNDTPSIAVLARHTTCDPTHRVLLVVLVECKSREAALDEQVGRHECLRPTQHATLGLYFHAQRAVASAQPCVIALQCHGDGWGGGCLQNRRMAAALREERREPGVGHRAQGVLVDIGTSEKRQHDVLHIRRPSMHGCV